MTAVAALTAAINSGMKQYEIAEALRIEHGFLVNNLVYGVALGVIQKCRFALRSDPLEPVASCGQVNYPLAISSGETVKEREDHPFHDGELTCNAVRGALITLNVKDNSWRQSSHWIWRGNERAY